MHASITLTAEANPYQPRSQSPTDHRLSLLDPDPDPDDPDPDPDAAPSAVEAP